MREKCVCVHERVVVCVNAGEMCVCVFVDAKEEISEILPLRPGEGGSSASGSTYPLATTP